MECAPTDSLTATIPPRPEGALAARKSSRSSPPPIAFEDLPPYHMHGCSADKSPLSVENEELGKALQSEDKYTKIVALEQALTKLIHMKRSDKEYAVLFSLAASALDAIKGADILFASLGRPPSPPFEGNPKQCCYLSDMPALLDAIHANLTLSPKHAFQCFERVHLLQVGTIPDGDLAQIFLNETLYNSKCYSEIDEIQDQQIPELFSELWDKIPETLRNEIRTAYNQRGGGLHMFSVTREIGEIMGVEVGDY